jgi:hypothetical protein
MIYPVDVFSMIASVTVEKIQGIADAIDKSTAGTAKTSRKFEEVTKRIISAKK